MRFGIRPGQRSNLWLLALRKRCPPPTRSTLGQQPPFFRNSNAVRPETGVSKQLWLVSVPRTYPKSWYHTYDDPR